ncbi:glucose-6-phosphate 1-dehydrogenase [Dietzia kunjamensis subsp. schimae]|uniref:Glucose-6-phosphate 1-dehydrogenase n=1 Tax=Dietzia kunjamensis subsp. schimae TaxID=498198 RepID=A0ABY1N3U4_9ACTN|nr:glucose-6-phosphate dehydrogenase [Dietzia kunjamensis]MBB1014592.1 glucose-6-phosphate dehydrogenase [Dietzia kunjamensis subsp. schimae]SMO80137.1 glucose-6-phosphate 1-dehydrogenase [Dietzia kunjamensis subsp. schimae]
MSPTTTDRPTLAILGAGGDLTERLLLPGLGTLLATDPDRDVTVIGSGRSGMDDGDWRDLVRSALRAGDRSPEQVDGIVDSTRFVELDVTDAEAFSDFIDGLDGPVVLYFALPPAVTAAACEGLRGRPLRDDVRFALEKPFGDDLASARRVNALLTDLVPEDRVYRVDHFLGEATVLNILGMRFANRIMEPVWTAEHVERIDVVADETLALEGRAGYYDSAGALVDMLQSHLLLVMALATMDAPARLDATELHDLIVTTLRATRVWDGDPLVSSRRGRYTAGRAGGRDVVSYADEDGVDPARGTETFAEVVLEIRNQRWAGVPVFLRSGKALGEDSMRVTVAFRPPRHVPGAFSGGVPPTRLTIGIAPDRVSLDLATNAADDRFTLESTRLAADLGDSELLPYGEVLGRILDGDRLLTVRGDVAEECWRILTPVIEAWEAGGVPLEEYEAGSDGPAVGDRRE